LFGNAAADVACYVIIVCMVWFDTIYK